MIKKKISYFQHVGNLAFYDGWHSNYVYFKSLLAAGEYFQTRTKYRPYSPRLAQPIAQKAISDATIAKNFNGESEEDSISHFSQRFQDIINFLKQAYAYEVSTEKAFFTNKYNQLINTFSEEERENIPTIQECLLMLKAGEEQVESFDYQKFNTLINILIQGYENSQTIAKYEAKRLEELDSAVTGILTHKKNQLEGQAFKGQWDDANKRIEKHYRRFKRNLTVSYIENGSMTKKENKEYIIRGAYRFAKFQDANQVADRKLSRWAEQIIQQLVTNKKVLAKLAATITKAYPINGDFTHLTEEVRSIIIYGVIEYGRQNLSKILNNRLRPRDLDKLADQMIDDNIFDTVKQFKIDGLPATIGQTVKEAKLLKDIKQISDMKNKEKAGEKLYSLVRDLFKEEQTLINSQDESYLIQAMKAYTKTSGVTAYEEADKIISIINELIKLRQQITADTKKSLNDIEAYQKEYEIKSKYTEPVIITVQIKNGQAYVDMDKINQMIVQEGIFKKSQAKRLETLINTLMAQSSQRLKQDIINSLENAHKSRQFQLTEDQLLNEVAGELRQIRIKIDGPKLSELIQSELMSNILNSINKGTSTRGSELWTGPNDNKNDNVTIEINDTAAMRNVKKQILKKFGADSTEIKDLNSAYKALNQAKANLFSTIIKEGQEAIAAATKNYDPKKGKTTSERYMVAAEYSYNNVKALAEENENINKSWRQVKTAAANLKKYLAQHQSESSAEINAWRMMTDMSSSFQISTTVKTYNTYNSQIGFVGGSLGANLSVQLDNIASIFNAAGLGGQIDEDLQWLHSAIINCSPKTIAGETNKGLIENYLAAAAAFALFDEGSQENMIISDTYKDFFNAYSNKSNAQILHLYRVNSVLVPGSQVLLRTINTLETEVIPQINKIPETMSRGAGITIINNIDESSIPNRPIAGHHLTDTNPWSTVGAEADKNVQLQILFLAGLMDIVNTINSELNGIEIPS